MQRFLIAICGLVLLSLAMPSQAADTIAYNLGNDVNGDVTINDAEWAAQAFTTLSGNVIDSIIVNMKRDEFATGTVNLYIYDLGGDSKPLSQVAFVGSIDIATELPGTPGNIAFTNLGINLASTTSYYLLMSGSGVSNGSARWSFTDNEAGTGFPSLYSRTLNTGSTWTTPSSESPQMMAITVVPEPSTLVLSAASAVAIGSIARRRRV